MGKIKEAVSNSGPLIHLSQVKSFDAFEIIEKIYITNEIFSEVCSSELPGNKEVRESKLIEVKDLKDRSKDMSKLISQKYSLDLGEATAISLAKQEKIKLFFTDDLAARIVAKELGLEVHGTIGIILRAFRSGIFTKERALKIIENLHTKSSIFITKDLVNYIIREINDYR
ncbi:MAG: DUF3368 domain-containing protein [Candidatus Aenigmarchaeota archaeon]|nr:DUF3368 domain-containing protein [Candidatus Aenigmarchaeota archaeon]